MNRPAVCNAEFWDMKTPDHGGKINLLSLSLIVCKVEALLNWRYQNYAVAIANSDAAAIVNDVDAKGGGGR